MDYIVKLNAVDKKTNIRHMFLTALSGVGEFLGNLTMGGFHQISNMEIICSINRTSVINAYNASLAEGLI